jgi:hypothetical protein
MPTTPCPNSNFNKPIAQTLFLGASVTSFNTGMGWDGQPPQLTVNLLEDDFDKNCAGSAPNSTAQKDLSGGTVYNQFVPGSFVPNHYHTCQGISCFANRKTGSQANDQTLIDDRIIPGKVYYYWGSNGLLSQYWYKTDPGFFGTKTRIKSDGTFDASSETGHPKYKYDIIDTPVYFKMGDFSFGGFVQSWNKTINSGGKGYSVVINGPQSILNSCYIILDKFAGAIFSKGNPNDNNNYYGSPKNYIKAADVNYRITNLTKGAIHNVFNVYGFLESFGADNFGVAKRDERGISLNKIIDALIVLTSTTHTSTSSLNLPLAGRDAEAIKRAFSPFGRIISRCMQQEKTDANLFAPISNAFNLMGVVPPSPLHIELTGGGGGVDRCQFVLDMYELVYDENGNRRIPDDVRIDNPVISIGELLNIIGEKIGHDFFAEMIPVGYAGQPYHIIKIKGISRLKQPSTNLIENTIKALSCGGIPSSSYAFGKEKNEAPSRALLIGGQQQRLLQVKSYRLAYSQSNFVYNPTTKKFINYYSLLAGPSNANAVHTVTTQYGHGKIKFPNFSSTRNPSIIDSTVGTTALDAEFRTLLKEENALELAASRGFGVNDTIWQDTETGATMVPWYGNYKPSSRGTHTLNVTGNSRWFPIHLDYICPFFGYVHEEEVTIKTNTSSESNTEYRAIRPVWFDTWTGQLAVIIQISELPTLNVDISRAGLESNTDAYPLPYTYAQPYGSAAFNNSGKLSGNTNVEYFVLTESEIRAAIAGFDNFLVYSLSKTYKPDLIELIRRAYFIKTRNNLVNAGSPLNKAIDTAERDTNWYWKLMGSNIGGDALYPTVLHPDKNDGSQYIQEKALQDLKIIHKFITQIAKFYGKKYMVTAPNLRSYRDELLSSVAFRSNLGYGYIFSGNGKLTYNYTPTNDGAWEEYGNIIDDCIAVGGTQWYALSDDVGKIKPILGYNNTYCYDYIRQNKCKAAMSSTFDQFKNVELNPYFDYNSWLLLYENKSRSCTDSFTFPMLDLSDLGSTDYVIVDQKYGSNAPEIINRNGVSTFSFSTTTPSYDAFYTLIKDQDGNNLPRSKVYVSATVEENFVYLDSSNLSYPKILIESPGVNLNASSEENSRDPNRTVISNVAIEDIIIYLKTSSAYDWGWIAYMMNYVSPVSIDDANNPYILGLYTVSSNSTANNVELAPKAAHPFFAGIPIRSNQYVYGPWTNYPDASRKVIYPSVYAAQEDCTNLSPIVPTDVQTRNALNNLITNVDIEIKEDLVPWTYGGSFNLDVVALKEIESKINYQAIIETGQLDIAGLPLFNLGGVFASGAYNSQFNYTVGTSTSVYNDNKETGGTLSNVFYPMPGLLTYAPAGVGNDATATYTHLRLTPTATAIVEGPIISNIQVSTGQQGVTSSYSFRTYTRKIGLFNREAIERTKKVNLFNMQRNKKISQISQEVRNLSVKQDKFLTDERLNNSQFGNSDLASKLFGWSPGTVLVGQAHTHIDEPNRSPGYVEDYSLYSDPGSFQSRPGAATRWSVGFGEDQGDDGSVKNNTTYLTSNKSPIFLRENGRIVSTVQLYERKEVEGQLNKGYGSQSAMSLDGLISPVSFFPTFKSGTFPFSLHMITFCPFCKGTKKRRTPIASYNTAGVKTITNVDVVCEKCTVPSEKLNAKLLSKNEDTEAGVAINAVTLNPIVVPYGEFKNQNHQHYSGPHPKGKHADISSESAGGGTRHFQDRLRHCIEIVARGSIPQNKIKYNLETSKNLTAYNNHPENMPKTNLDYFGYDLALFDHRAKVNDTNNWIHEMNQRFMGLRGPLVLHSWGYDQDGYPVPNASEEPYAYDQYGRPKRFKLKITNEPQITYGKLTDGQLFKATQTTTTTDETGNTTTETNAIDILYAKTANGENIPPAILNVSQQITNEDVIVSYTPQLFTDDSVVVPVKLEDDLKNAGGYDPGQSNQSTSSLAEGFKGSIIKKTQKYENGQWSESSKLQEFYLNWAERPDLWKVGPIDLFWDEERNVWTAGGGGGATEIDPPYILTNKNDITTLKDFLDKKSNKKYIYKMIYITLEEDLIKQPDFDETFVSRGYIDDIEFSSEPLQQGYRRLVYIKDKTGYCAPRGTKLLCRYNRSTGFYEPVTKPSLVVKGKLTSATQALIDMHYVQGRRAGVVPTMTVNFDNPLGFTTTTNAIAIFTFINGKWTLTAIK